jgi:hypothetical protein
MFASNFDSLGLLFVAAFLVVCSIVVAGGVVFRIRSLQVSCAIVFLFVAALMFRALSSFTSKDRDFAIGVGLVAFALGASSLLLSLVRKK